MLLLLFDVIKRKCGQEARVKKRKGKKKTVEEKSGHVNSWLCVGMMRLRVNFAKKNKFSFV